MDLAGRPRFFIRAAVGYAISGAVLTGRKVADGLSGLFLW